jgi:GMP synthase (glutamine-hydrolysing)
VKPFLLIATRAEDAAADNEYAAFCQYMELEPRLLVRHRLEQDPLGEIDLSAYSGILLGGSPFNATDPEESKSALQRRVEAELRRLIDVVVGADFPLLGACYGISAVGGPLGAVLDRTYAEPVGPVTITMTDEGRADPLLADLPTSFEAFVGHKEAISSLPARCVLLAGSPSCPVQMFRVGHNVYATQFHPELDITGLCTRVEVYKHAGYFPPEEAEQVKTMARRSSVVHPPAILRAFVRLYGRTPAMVD